ncbi:unnamed protein product [Adineta steineri]|uniref:AMOP domain-containing protein n=1 Tax=Adineta steineri TaxID=433720 RepID=A0A819F6V2_9BILA|nr:unnamed protein product [Adineta steineri]CAF3863507.1 unnamed protein product [Adineta steineri]
MLNFLLLAIVATIYFNANIGSVRAATVAENTAWCKKWYDAEPHPSVFMAQTPKCPCHMPTNFPSQYNDGTRIWKTDSGCQASSQPNTCSYHKGAWGCYRFAPKSSGPGSQCCYTKDGKYMDDPFEGAGTLDRECAPENFFNLFQWLAHNDHDVVPYDKCCADLPMPREVCGWYYDRRPAMGCVN